MKRIIFAALLTLCLAFVVAGQTRLKRGPGEVSINASGDISLTPASGRKVSVTGRHVPFATKTALTAAATVTVDSSLGNFFTLTPGEDEAINATTVGLQGQILIIKITTSGTTSHTLTFGTNFISTGTLATGTTSGKVFMIAFLSDGTNYVELFRTGAM